MLNRWINWIWCISVGKQVQLLFTLNSYLYENCYSFPKSKKGWFKNKSLANTSIFDELLLSLESTQICQLIKWIQFLGRNTKF